jgi:hypothetical protein
MADKKDCIDAKFVPCEKARAYLEKHGRLCGTDTAEQPDAHKPKPKKTHKKGFLDRWLG